MSDLIQRKEVTASQIPLISFAARGCLLYDQPSFEEWLSSYLKVRVPTLDESKLRRQLLHRLGEMNKKAREEASAATDLASFLQPLLSFYFSSSDLKIECLSALDSYRAHVRVVLPDSVFDVCEQLKKRGYRLAILSNEGQSLVEVLKMYRLFDYFDCVCVAEETRLYKPDPRAFEDVQAEFDLKPQQMVHVGDRYATDILGAERAGVHRILYDPKNYEMLAVNELEDVSQKVVSIESLRKNRALSGVKVITKFSEILDFFK